MMWSALAILLFCSGIFAASNDFDIISGSYEFIYHRNQELLLTIHNKKCYHTHIKGINCPQMLETQVMIQVHYDDHTSHSSLQELRNKFEDLLANFHCLDKDVYQLNINSDFSCDGTSGDHDD